MEVDVWNPHRTAPQLQNLQLLIEGGHKFICVQYASTYCSAGSTRGRCVEGKLGDAA